MNIIPGTSFPVISPLAHLIQDSWHYPTPDQSGLKIVRTGEAFGSLYQD